VWISDQKWNTFWVQRSVNNPLNVGDPVRKVKPGPFFLASRRKSIPTTFSLSFFAAEPVGNGGWDEFFHATWCEPCTFAEFYSRSSVLSF
jgi:hypothetical protein